MRSRAFPGLGLPRQLQAELEELIAAHPSRSPEEVIAYDVFDESHPLNDFVYKLLKSDKTAVKGLRLYVEVLGAAFARSADIRTKQGACVQLMAFLREYVERHVTADIDALSMFMSLKYEIINIADGRVTSFLTAQRTKRRRRQATQDVDLWAAASALVDMLIEIGFTEKEAAEAAVQFLKIRGFPVPPATRTSEASAADRILNWRARLRQAKGTGARAADDARAAYETAKSVVRQANDLELAVDLLVRWMEMMGTKGH